MNATPATHQVSSASNPQAQIITCVKCRGTGWYNQNRKQYCFGCNGQKQISYVSNAEDRASGDWQIRKAAIDLDKAARLADFVAEHPKVANFLLGAASSWRHANDTLGLIQRFGGLTEEQLRDMARAADIEHDRVKAREAYRASPDVDVSLIRDALLTAKANGLLRPALRFGTYYFSLAPEEGNNPGALYIKDKQTKEYLGKCLGGRFRPSGNVSTEQHAEILAIAANPTEAAIRYGKLSQCCSLCGRRLDDPQSIERGVGPVCLKKFGWTLGELNERRDGDF